MIVADLDGVFANFADAAASLHDKHGTKITKWDFFKDWKLNERQFWQKIHDQGDSFYRDMVLPYPWALELLELIEGADEFVILSHASDHPCGYAAKKLWVDKYLQPHTVTKIDVMVGQKKYLLARKDRLLIDDNTPNCELFREQGGYAIEFPQPWNAKSRYSHGAMAYVRDQVNTWKAKRVRDEAKNPSWAAKKLWPKGDSPGY